jgi:hypothetical protein
VCLGELTPTFEPFWNVERTDEKWTLDGQTKLNEIERKLKEIERKQEFMKYELSMLRPKVSVIEK